MKSLAVGIIVALIALAFMSGNEQPLHAQLTDQVQTAYYPAVATYTPDKIVGAMEVTALDTPYQPKVQQVRVQYANYANYAGNYAAGYRQQNACCNDGNGGSYGYFGDGMWVPGRGVARWVANGGWFPGKFALRFAFGRWRC